MKNEKNEIIIEDTSTSAVRGTGILAMGDLKYCCHCGYYHNDDYKCLGDNRIVFYSSNGSFQQQVLNKLDTIIDLLRGIHERLKK